MSLNNSLVRNHYSQKNLRGKHGKSSSMILSGKRSKNPSSRASVQAPKPLPEQVRPRTVSKRRTSNEYYHDHLKFTMNALKVIRRWPQPSIDLIAKKTVKMPEIDKKTVVFDLDETLVHCVEDGQPAESYLTIKTPYRNKTIGINVRPFAREMLRAIRPYYEVVIFTASHQYYADTVIDFIDPNKELVDMRLYRSSCLMVKEMYVKDLRIFQNRKLEDIVIVDNSVFSFGFQLNNGVPIISWFDDYQDRELYNLIEYLIRIYSVRDVRATNTKTFKLESTLIYKK